MPPAITDSEDSADEMPASAPKAANRKPATPRDDDQSITGVQQTRARRPGKKLASPQLADDEDEDENETGGSEEELAEDEYIVEKILGHMLEGGILKYKVKWEGYNKKSDLTWEPEENLKGGASELIDAYHKAHGSPEELIRKATDALKTKKRGRPPASASSAPGKKRARRGSKEEGSSKKTVDKPWTPPAGSWESLVKSLDAGREFPNGDLTIFVTWKNGEKSNHPPKTVYMKCPQRMLEFYERHIKIVPREEASNEAQ